MARLQSSKLSLTSYEAALALLYDGSELVQPQDIELSEAIGCIAASSVSATEPYPARDVATRDGWAVRAEEVVGASSYSPVLLSVLPPWVETGDNMPPGCNCVLDTDMVEQAGTFAQVVSEVIPGTGIRRIGQEMAKGSVMIAAGTKIRAVDLLIGRSLGLTHISVRRPLVKIINIPSAQSNSSTTQFIAQAARGAGARIDVSEASGRDVSSIANAVEAGSFDLLVMIGGTGMGRTDMTADALISRGSLRAHGIAIEPGKTSAIGRIGSCPLIALPGSWDHAFGGWLAFVSPILNKLSGFRPRPPVSLPLARKISSAPGMTEIVFLSRENESWLPLSIGDLSLENLSRADAWLAVSGDSEGCAAGTLCSAFPLRDV